MESTQFHILHELKLIRYVCVWVGWLVDLYVFIVRAWVYVWRPEVSIRCLPELHFTLFVGSGAYRVPPADSEICVCRPKAWAIGVSPKPFLFCEC